MNTSYLQHQILTIRIGLGFKFHFKHALEVEVSKHEDNHGPLSCENLGMEGQENGSITGPWLGMGGQPKPRAQPVAQAAEPGWGHAAKGKHGGCTQHPLGSVLCAGTVGFSYPSPVFQQSP